ncbi:MAG: DNA methyltransferase, partial [bacterium]
MASFPSIRIEGGLLGPDLLDQLVAGDLQGQKAVDFGLETRRNLTDEIAAVFADARAIWGVFQNRLARLEPADLATTVTRDAWVIPFLGLLGYEPRFNQKAYELDGMTFAVSHRASEVEDAPPLYIVGARQELGRLAASGRPRLAPHSLVQEYLNRTDHVWGLVTNGTILRVLRDSSLVRRQAYVEFDLAGIFDEKRFLDFVALYRLLHRTRLPKGISDSSECLLEKYYAQSVEQGGRVRDHLRDGVEECIERLANGFLAHPKNDELRRRLKEGHLKPEDFYRELLRLIYRFLFLLVSEDRGLLSTNPVYREHYGIARLRRLLDRRSAFTEYNDLWYGLRVLWQVFGKEEWAAMLELAPLNGELFAAQTLDGCSINNRDLLGAFWYLAYYQESASAPARRVNYAALDVEELGSVYESLLEFHPAVDRDTDNRLTFKLIFGSERKTTGSYYTPPALVNELVQSALVPVIQERMKAAGKAADAVKLERELLSIRVCDPACGSGHFLLAAGRRIGKELAKVRSGEQEPAPERVREAVRDVIAHCIYGVDRNPLAVDLCRVALWIESHTAGKPLSFLDHRIRCGDSLVGVFNPEVLLQGIPDKAYDPVSGDDRGVARDAKRRNREAFTGTRDLFSADEGTDIGIFAETSQALDAIPDDSPEQIRHKKERYEAVHRDPNWLRQKQAYNLWTAAFFQRFTGEGAIITSAALSECRAGRQGDARIQAIAAVLAARLRFFHWPLEFPEIFSQNSKGFDVLLSNPPWERIKLQEQEFFAARDAAIATAPNKA